MKTISEVSLRRALHWVQNNCNVFVFFWGVTVVIAMGCGEQILTVDFGADVEWVSDELNSDSSPEPAAAQDESEDKIVKRGDRLLGLGVTEGSVGYGKAFAAAKSAGIQFIELPQQWDEVEQRRGRFKSALLPVANQVYSASQTSLVLSLNPIDTNSLRVPKHLRGKKFDDPEFIAAFIKFVDFVLGQLPDVKIAAIAIGNEVDGVLGNDPQKWAAYSRFFSAVKQHLDKRTDVKDVPCGVKITWGAVLGVSRRHAHPIHEAAGVLMITYYPLDEEFHVRAPSVVEQELASLVKLAGKKPVYLLETGYPSGEKNRSSLGQQAEFVSAIFKAWDKHNEQIRMVNFVWLHEMTESEVDTLTKYYSVRLPGFRSFLATLGLRSNAGKDKPAFQRLKKCASARGW